MSVRVRFAPSPTGYLHVGNARTALYNWLLARSRGGTFVLRSDDTDVERSQPEYQEDILANLRWLGLDWDEGVEVGGPHPTYRQSERFDRYREGAADMVAAGRAYPCFCTAAELSQRRSEAEAAGRPPGYDGRCRAIPEGDAAARLAGGETASTRFAVPRPGQTAFVDVVRGDVSFDHDHVDDFVIMRSDGSPTYHLASSVDDVDFGITHVVRGEDILSSTPKHIMVSDAIGGAGVTYAHLPLLRGPDGAKLSKRHGDTSMRHYRESGYLPEALLNYMALLGWSPGDDETVVTREEMVDRFDLGDVSKSAAIFDTAKLDWMNGVYVRDLPEGEFGALTLPLVEADLGRSLDEGERETFSAIAPLVQERAKLLTEAPEQVRFLFVAELEMDPVSWEKVMTKPEAAVALDGAVAALEGLGEWATGTIEAALRDMLSRKELSARKGLQPLRVAVTGSTVSPPLFESMAALGRGATLARLTAAMERISPRRGESGGAGRGA